MSILETTYLGMKLKNPLVAASSGLTGSIDKIKELEDAGIAAVVLKSVFEEQIMGEIGDMLTKGGGNTDYPEAEYYISNYVRTHSIGKQASLTEEVKKKTGLPVICSINCVSSSEWTSFAGDLEASGADAIELNVFYLPVNRNQSSADIEKLYSDILYGVKEKVRIPVSVKIGSYFTNITGMVEKLKANGARGVVMFNRFYEPDIDIGKLELKASEVFSSPAEFTHTLRWIGVVSSRVPNIELAATTGIHTGETVIKVLLAGARVAQLCSALYIRGSGIIPQILKELVTFMEKWNFGSIDAFRGRLSAKNIPDPMKYERSQFMKYYSNR
jgi:dihydroorotate dehydrogenase (fumarate)